MNEILVREQRKRISLLYLIYRESWGDTSFPVSLKNIQHGTDPLMGKAPAYLSKTAKYLVEEKWINQRSDFEDIVFITHPGIKQAEQWERDFGLEQRIKIDKLHEENQREITQNIIDHLGIESEYFQITRPRFLINWGKTALNEPSANTHSLVPIFEKVVESFNESELRTLCFELNIEFEDLNGANRKDKIRELLTFLNRRNEVEKLIEKLEEKRPQIKWRINNP